MITGANVVSGDHATIIASQTIINYTVNDSAVIIKLLAQLEEKDRQIAELLAIVRQLKSQSRQ